MKQKIEGDPSKPSGITALGAQISEFKITKKMDSSSPILNLLVASGNVVPQIRLNCVNTDKDGNQEIFMEYILENAIVTSISMSGDGAKTKEALTITFTKIEWVYTAPPDEYSAGHSVSASWDRATNTGESE